MIGPEPPLGSSGGGRRVPRRTVTRALPVPVRVLRRTETTLITRAPQKAALKESTWNPWMIWPTP